MIEPLWKVERDAIIETLEYFSGNRTRTANALEISIRSLRMKIRQYQRQGHWIPEASGRVQYGIPEKAQDERPFMLRFEMMKIL
jgi:hypothetical protein